MDKPVTLELWEIGSIFHVEPVCLHCVETRGYAQPAGDQSIVLKCKVRIGNGVECISQQLRGGMNVCGGTWSEVTLRSQSQALRIASPPTSPSDIILPPRSLAIELHTMLPTPIHRVCNPY